MNRKATSLLGAVLAVTAATTTVQAFSSGTARTLVVSRQSHGTPLTPSTAAAARSSGTARYASRVDQILTDLEDLEKSAPKETSKASNEDTGFLEKIIGILNRVDELQSSKEGLKELRDGVVGKKSDAEGGDAVGSRRKVTTSLDDVASSATEFAKRVARKEVLKSDEDIEDEEDEEHPEGISPSVVKAAAVAALLSVLVGEKNGAPMKYATYPPHAEYPNYKLSGMMKLAAGNPQPQYIFSPRKTIRVFIRALRAFMGLQLSNGATNRADTYEKKNKAFFSPSRIFFGLLPNPFNLMPEPKYCISNLDSDKEFARQFFNGVNPVMIRVCSDPQRQLTRELMQFFRKEGINVKQLASEDRLFYVSYDELADLEKNPHDAYPEAYNQPPKPLPEPRHYHPAIGVFVLDEKERMELDVLAIQLDRRSDGEVQIFSRDTCKDANEWFMAKTCLTGADSQYHEWVSHLGNTHLTFEPHIIAIHNTLKMDNHPVFVFLEPLLKDTLFLNWAARRTLAEFGPDAFGDRVTSIGIGQYMQLIEKKWQTYDFFKSSALPQELESRGFTEDFECPGYLFREDGLRLWDAIGEFATNFVNEVYKTDADVKKDSGLQKWAKETTNPSKGAVPGFPKKFQDKDTLVSVLQTLMWITSGLHAAVNFPQYDFLAYAPNKPLGHRREMQQYQEEGAKSSDPREWIFRKTMPYVGIAKEVALVTRLLTLPSERNLDQLEDHFDSAPGKKSYEKFVDKLDAIGDIIEDRNARNKAAGKAVYPYLNPSVVPVSIDI